MKTGLLFCLAAFSLSVCAADEAPRRDPFLAPEAEIRAMIPQSEFAATSQVSVQFDWIKMPHLTANQLLRQHLVHSTDGDALYAAVQGLIAQQKAERLDLTALVVRAGQRSKIETIIERSYATEFDPAQSIEYVKPTGEKVLDGFSPVTPNSFAWRSTGRTVEVEATIAEDSSVIDMNLAPEWVEKLTEWTWGQGVSAVKQPVFGTVKGSSQMLCGNGEWELVGLFNPPWLPEGDRLPGSAPLPADRMLLFVKAATEKKPEAKARLRVRQVTALVEWIEIDTATASALLAQHSAFTDATALRDALEPMLTDGRATLVESAALPIRSGQRSKTQSITEFPYPAEVDPPNGVPAGLAGAPTLTAPQPPQLHIVPATPNSYSFRDLGTSVELEATVGEDGVTIDMNCAPELVFLHGFDSHGEGVAEAKHPRFQTFKTVCQVLLRSGAPAMIAAFDSPVADGKPLPAVRPRKVLLFIRGIL